MIMSRMVLALAAATVGLTMDIRGVAAFATPTPEHVTAVDTICNLRSAPTFGAFARLESSTWEGKTGVSELFNKALTLCPYAKDPKSPCPGNTCKDCKLHFHGDYIDERVQRYIDVERFCDDLFSEMSKGIDVCGKPFTLYFLRDPAATQAAWYAQDWDPDNVANANTDYIRGLFDDRETMGQFFYKRCFEWHDRQPSEKTICTDADHDGDTDGRQSYQTQVKDWGTVYGPSMRCWRNDVRRGPPPYSSEVPGKIRVRGAYKGDDENWMEQNYANIQNGFGQKVFPELVAFCKRMKEGGDPEQKNPEYYRVHSDTCCNKYPLYDCEGGWTCSCSPLDGHLSWDNKDCAQKAPGSECRIFDRGTDEFGHRVADRNCCFKPARASNGRLSCFSDDTGSSILPSFTHGAGEDDIKREANGFPIKTGLFNCGDLTYLEINGGIEKGDIGDFENHISVNTKKKSAESVALGLCTNRCMDDATQKCCRVPKSIAAYFPCCWAHSCCPEQLIRHRRRALGESATVSTMIDRGSSHERYTDLLKCLDTGDTPQSCKLAHV